MDDSATREKVQEIMLEVIPDFISAEDRFLFYFSGHGVTRNVYDGTKRGYLVTSSSPTKKWSKMISMDDIERWSRFIAKAHQSLWIIDSCFSGLAGIKKKSLGSKKTFNRIRQRAHHLITAGSGGEPAIILRGRSLFTKAFIEAARNADYGINGLEADGITSLTEIFGYLGKAVDRELSNKKHTMTPQKSSLHDDYGEFYFLANKNTSYYTQHTNGIHNILEKSNNTESNKKSEIIRSIQNNLKSLLLYDGPIDGYLEPQTKKALLLIENELNKKLSFDTTSSLKEIQNIDKAIKLNKYLDTSNASYKNCILKNINKIQKNNKNNSEKSKIVRLIDAKPTEFVIYFGWSRFNLTKEGCNVMEAIANTLVGYKDPIVYILGHNDTSETKKMSYLRSAYITNSLKNIGVKGYKMQAIGQEELYKATDDNVREPLNRRVTISIQERKRRQNSDTFTF